MHRQQSHDQGARSGDQTGQAQSALTPGEKLLLADQLSIDVEMLARAGIAATEPDASPERVRYLLALRRYGRDIAEKLPAPSE